MIGGNPGYVIKDGKKLRCGFTTGSCAAGAAKAAAMMLRGEEPDSVEIDTPAGVLLNLVINGRRMEKDQAVCSIIKDAGDDPDVTDGIEIFARVSKRQDGRVLITGGEGIGIITRKGFFGEAGEYAINKVPREMIQRELKKVDDSGYDVEIFAPAGVEIGKKTFNSNIGIDGGISIIGSTGIVEPMSEKALLDTIYLEMDQVKLDHGLDGLLLVPGNHGEKFARKLGYRLPGIKMSNYVGEALQYAYSIGFRSLVLVGHVGKLSKLSIGAFNTHSRVCDTRLEAFVYHLVHMEAPIDFIRRIETCLTAEEALHLCADKGYGDIAKRMENSAQKRIRTYLKDEDLDVRVVVYSMERGVELC